jgi:hypothetical protein
MLLVKNWDSTKFGKSFLKHEKFALQFQKGDSLGSFCIKDLNTTALDIVFHALQLSNLNKNRSSSSKNTNFDFFFKEATLCFLLPMSKMQVIISSVKYKKIVLLFSLVFRITHLEWKKMRTHWLTHHVFSENPDFRPLQTSYCEKLK